MIDIRAITELVQELRKGNSSKEEVEQVALRLSRNSLARKANDAILQFPVIVSSNLDVDTMTMINRALEREYASFAMLAMGLDNVVNAEDFDKRKFIQKYHQNVGTRRNTSYLSTKDASGNYTFTQESMELLNRPYNEDLRLDTLNEKTNKGNSNNYVLSEAKTRKGNGDRNSQEVQGYLNRRNQHNLADKNNTAQMERQKDSQEFTADQNRLQKAFSAGQGRLQRDHDSLEKQKNRDWSDGKDQAEWDYNSKVYNNRNNGKDTIISTEYRKANDLVPTVLNIGLTGVGERGAIDIDLMIGIKTIAHPVTSEEIINNLHSAVENDRFILRTIKWTTGEIKFFRDYLFMVDQMKGEALQNRSNSRWWRTLASRSREDRIRRALLRDKQILPNATIIMTMEEVEELKNRYGINLLTNVAAVRTLMHKYFLLGFVIADSSSDMAYFYFDGQRDYQTFTYASLERENTSSNNEVRSLVNLMNTMR